MPYTLENYLRTYRRRAGLSQDEMAFLLGTKSGTKVSRYERLHREPSLRTAFAYEVIFRAPLRDLFGGAYEKTARATLRRRKLLIEKLREGRQDRLTAHKLAALGAVSQVERTSARLR